MSEFELETPVESDRSRLSEQHVATNAKSSKIAVLALAFAAFALGSTEFVVVGLLPEIANSLSVTVDTAALLVSIYALTIFVATPFVAAATSHISTRKLIFTIMAVFSACNIVAGIAPSYAVLVAARIVMAVTHGAFFGVAATLASSLVDKSKAGRAIATITTGVTVAMVVGVPLGAWAGQTFSWRIPFVAIGVMSVVSLALLAFSLPQSVENPPHIRIVHQLGQLANLRFLNLYVMTALAIAATLVFFTFVSPFLTSITGVSQETVGLALFVFGSATVLGNLLGGRLTDSLGWRNAMSLELVGLFLSLVLAFIVAQHEYLTLIAIALIGFFGFAIPSVVQAGILETAKRDAADAVGTASGMTVAAINFGITSGSFVGSILLTGPGLISTPIVGAIFAAAAFVLVRLLSDKTAA